MKAVVLKEANQLELCDIPVPECQADSILLRVETCGLSGIDLEAYRHGHPLMSYPRIPGHEIAGTIIEVGKNVHGYYDSERVVVASTVPCGNCLSCRSGWEPICDNQRLIGYSFDGGLAEYMLVPPQAIRSGCVNKIPDGVTLDAAALAESLAFCISAQDLAWMAAGKTVVVMGAGPMGCLHVQVARASGGARIVLADKDAKRLDLARKMCGATRFVNTALEDLEALVMTLTEGCGAELVIVACSEADAMEYSFKLVAKRGVINFFGGRPKDNPTIRLDSNLLHEREFYIVGNHGAAPRHYVRALNLIGGGNLNVEPVITHIFELDHFHEAFQAVGKREGLKVIVHP